MSLSTKTLRQLGPRLAEGRTSSRALTEQALAAASTSSEAATTFLAVHAATALEQALSR